MSALADLRYRINARTFRCMLRIYCQKHHNDSITCETCQSILDYTLERHRKCPFGPMKPVCSKCEIHCFKKDMAEKVREVMTFSGPRMTYRHPLLAFYHVFERLYYRKTSLKKRPSRGSPI